MSPESSTCPHVVLKNKGLNLGRVCPEVVHCLPTRGVRPRGRGRAQTPVGSHRWWGTPGPSPVPVAVPSRARPGDPLEPHLQLGARDLGAGDPVGPRGVRHGRARPGPEGGVPTVQIGHARAAARTRPISRGVQLGRVPGPARAGGCS